MIRVLVGQRQRITKHCRRLVERDPMLPAILSRFPRVPFKSHRRILLHHYDAAELSELGASLIITVIIMGSSSFRGGNVDSLIWMPIVGAQDCYRLT